MFYFLLRNVRYASIQDFRDALLAGATADCAQPPAAISTQHPQQAASTSASTTAPRQSTAELFWTK
jgi:hypothetical protein